jgi:hypothetical protein
VRHEQCHTTTSDSVDAFAKLSAVFEGITGSPDVKLSFMIKDFFLSNSRPIEPNCALVMLYPHTWYLWNRCTTASAKASTSVAGRLTPAMMMWK